MRRRIRIFAVLLLLGLATTLGVAWLCTAVVDITNAPVTTAGGSDWTANIATTAGAMRITSNRRTASWSPAQATGAPDTPSAGDYATAWAPATSNGSPEWIEMEFDQAVVPWAIDVYESYHPGSITSITLITDDGNEIEMFSGDDPTSPQAAHGTSHFEMPPDLQHPPAVKRVKIYQGRQDVQGWNEIDAVGLIEKNGTTHWAIGATASSWYGQGSSSGNNAAVAAMVPGWSGLHKPSADWLAKRVKEENRLVDARGWPMLALWGEADTTKLAASSAAPSSGTVLLPPSASTGSTINMSGFNLTSTYTTGTLVLSGTSSAVAPPAQVAVFPWRPIWIGLAVNTVIFAAIWGVIGVLVLLPRRFFREVGRLRRGCCIACGYDLGYDFPRGCPECGWRRDNQSTTETRRHGEEKI